MPNYRINVESANYKFRNLPCSVVPDEELWYVGGIFLEKNGDYMSGIFEWCVNQADARFMYDKMSNDPRFIKLYFEKFLNN